MGDNIQRVLVTGALGQIGSELCASLRQRYGADNVVASDCKDLSGSKLAKAGPTCTLDVLDRALIEKTVVHYKIDTIVHLAAILSATGEANPDLAWKVNMDGLYNVLEVGRVHHLNQVMVPSSIAVFGPGTPLENTPNDTILRPSTMYGLTKVAGELLGSYYFDKFGLDVRGLRYPGIISAETPPGGGTTDYAVAIFYEAVKHGRYTCFVRDDTRLPMMYMPDCLKATMDLMVAPLHNLKHHTDFNVGAMSFRACELAAEIRKHIPSFQCDYQPDRRQNIADSWPRSVADDAARREWGWRPNFDLETMTEDMIKRLQARHQAGEL
ncbi:MAG: NAD-dependent epimerase/dehydratase family protein [Myxococcota bacterium]|jgi:nucleoside-diphosphate-sugar epimerase|nr:NAD-dependent epimerase/dehydratase family protein [Myxococcota bacterium]